MGRFNENVEVSEARVGKIDDGKKHATSIRQAGVSDGGSLTLWAQNPADSGEDAYFVVTLSPSALASVEISTDVSQDGSGSTTTVINAKPLSGVSPNVNTRTGDTYTINGKTLDINLPGGETSGPGSGGSSSELSPTTYLLEEDVSMLFELYNRSGGSTSLGISATWFEVTI